MNKAIFSSWHAKFMFECLYKGLFRRMFFRHSNLWVSGVNIRRHSHWRKASRKVILSSLWETFGSSQKFGFECVLIIWRPIHINWRTRKLFITVRNEACVKNSVQEGVCLSAYWNTHPPGQTPPVDPPPRPPLQRTVRILLECFLVSLLSLAPLEV